MPRRLPAFSALLAVSACVFAACGGAGDASRGSAAPDVRAAKPASPAGPMRVTAIDGRLGDATAADRDGVRELPGIERIDPDRLRREVERRDGVGAGASCADADVMPAADNLAVVGAATLCLLNGERADAGLAPLAQNGALAQAATAHSQDMVVRQYFDHLAQDGRDIVDRITATGYIPDDGAWTVGENLAWGTGTLATPRSTVTAWMNSPGHRANILRGEFREIGLGIVLGNPRSTDGQGATYTTNFGATDRVPAAPPAAVSEVADAVPARPATASRDDADKARRAKARHRKLRNRRKKARRARMARARRAAAAAARS